MTALTVRRLLVDLETPFDRRWNGGSAFRSAFFDALSFSFPAGEQFFIDSVKLALPRLPEAERERFADEVRAFIGQEATHRRIHERFNLQLERQGLVNRWDARIRERSRQLEGVDPRGWLAVTAATEHLTAVFADHLLAHPEALAGAPPHLRDLWIWHSAEESEHRSTAFDVYRALGGNEYWRRRLFLLVSWYFATDLVRQTVNNLWRDGSLFRWRTWADGARFLFGRGGLVRCNVGAWRAYLKPDFHPAQGDRAPALAWLAAHVELAPPVK